ncbi:Ca2+-dependent phosphoinositide-specific phospholipase C [uncultured Cyclobacterium sp.]|uniref:Ca2+-dependent phosphoinositide-specific phospholipase C n=1 Tax=uncultured Cyclobacterium sp. TaxID=453820 RepID=UPI0030ED2931|tara:strand:+ start:151484 stop:152914 length:1431 start_codon:yes stop_codon:yes gene_type:complete
MFLRCFIIWLSVLFVGCDNTKQQEDKVKPLKINQIQLIGTHNSYKRAIPAVLLNQIKKESPEMAQSLDYSHPELWDQLGAGLRLLELDVYHDPEGGRFSNPLGKEAIAAQDWDLGFDKPGFKVFHVQDIDFLSHHALLSTYLSDLKNWSNMHPNHLPIFISLNAKDTNYPGRGFAEALPFDRTVFTMLDEEIEEFLGIEKLITPKELKGASKDLRTAVTQYGWPELSQAKGKFIFILDEGEPKVSEYLSTSNEDKDRLMFVTVPEEHPLSAIHIINDPINNHDQIKSLVEKGYIVRTRADAETKEARSNSIKRRDMAFSSGAQLISTDYFVADQRFEGDYKVQFEGGTYARIHPFIAESSASNEALSEDTDRVVILNPQVFSTAANKMEAVVLDVRTKQEVDQGMISGAVNIDFLEEGFAEKISGLDRSQTILVYCKVGGRSGKAAELLVSKGFKHVYNLEGGYDLWKENGLPVTE